MTNRQEKQEITSKIDVASLNEGSSANFWAASPERLKELLRDDIHAIQDKMLANLIGVFGIFASIISFLVIEFQILKNICDFMKLLGFSAFLLGGMLLFIFLLLYMLNYDQVKKNWLMSLIIVLFCISLFGFSIWSISHSKSEYTCKELEIEGDISDFKAKTSDEIMKKLKLVDDKLQRIK